MLQQHVAPLLDESGFGTLIFTWRGRIKRTKILAHLPGWSKDIFYRLEKGEIAPAFDQLLPLFRALWLAEVPIPPDGPQVFLKHARERIESKRTHLEYRTEEEWGELCDDLVRIDSEFRSRGRSRSLASPNPLLADTSHLIRRDGWHMQMKQQLSGPERKKVIVVPGPSGIGKTSELSRFAAQLRRANSHRPILCDFRWAERMLGPEEALDVFMGTVLSALGYAQPQVPPASLEERVIVLLEQLEESPLPVVMIVDHAECILSEQGRLAACWERFLIRILKYQHRAALVLATRQWPAWFGGELRFLTEVPVPPLSREQGVLLLQQLGLKAISQGLLQEVYERVGGIPICLEWVAALVKQPVFVGDGEPTIHDALPVTGAVPTIDMTRAVRRLLSEPYIFGGTLGGHACRGNRTAVGTDPLELPSFSRGACTAPRGFALDLSFGQTGP
jgi:hypothetical protein